MARSCVIIVDGAGGGNTVYDGDNDMCATNVAMVWER